ncbi:CBS domain-containing protein [Streptomyces sp. TRM49041]|uniref:CBS domain-containing protein n=1 Tax=Streptomyces sp. TRM49041 TaxID=2603216 RepID=UPI0011EE56BD|nr:CBS domain-containing protein [Streptomyces sp. TRM49041]
MHASDLAEPYPTVSTDDDAVTAARLFVEHRLPALLVVDRDGRPYAIVPGSQLLALLVPEFARDRPSLASALRAEGEDTLPQLLEGLSVAEWIPGQRVMPTVVGPGAGALEIAALMCSTHTPLVAVVEADGDRVWTSGAITAARLMEHFLVDG